MFRIPPADDPSDDNANTLTTQTVALNKNTKGIKILGVRNLRSETAINADWSALGIEFTATCEGDMTFGVVTGKSAYFRAYVDDEEWMNGESPYFTVNGQGQIVLKDIPTALTTSALLK